MRHQQDLYHNLMWVEGGNSEVNKLMALCRWRGSHFHNCHDYNGIPFSIIQVLAGGAHFLGFCGQENFFIYGNLQKCGIFFNYMQPTSS